MARASARRSPWRRAAISSSVVTPSSVRRERGFALCRLLLAGPHPGVHTATQQQLPMVAALDDPTVVEHEDLVGIDDRRQPVRDDQGGAVSRNFGEARLNLAFGLGI